MICNKKKKKKKKKNLFNFYGGRIKQVIFFCNYIYIYIIKSLFLPF